MITVMYTDTVPKMGKTVSPVVHKYGAIPVFPGGCGEEAPGDLSRHDPDVIIPDYDLPKMSGRELLQILCSRGSSLPFIFFSESGRIHIKKDVPYGNKTGSPEMTGEETCHGSAEAILPGNRQPRHGIPVAGRGTGP